MINKKYSEESLAELAANYWNDERAIELLEAYGTDDLEIVYLFIRDGVYKMQGLGRLQCDVFKILWENELI